ncbi:MAG: hypothetical protein WCT05_00820 [Lentisphaeria bacterium]
MLKFLYLLSAMLAAALAILLGWLPLHKEKMQRTEARDTGVHSLLSTEKACMDSAAPLILAARRITETPASATKNDVLVHIPWELESWQESLLCQLREKADLQNLTSAEVKRQSNGEMQRKRRGFRRNVVGESVPSEEEEPASQEELACPYQLWRELQLRGDNSLTINLLLVNNQQEAHCHGVIIDQKIPQGWEIREVWPEAQVSDPLHREIKWLFAEASSRENWVLQVVLSPIESAANPLLPEDHSAFRYCLTDGNPVQYACRTLP